MQVIVIILAPRILLGLIKCGGYTMSECEINAAFEKKLQQLKVQEELIVKLLKNIQSQLKKYEVMIKK